MSQKLILPMKNVFITAGYKSADYYKYWKFQHYGTDCVSSTDRNITAQGKGVVLAAGADGATPSERLGNVLVIKYPDVQCNDGTVCDLICRMYHLDQIFIKAGNEIDTGAVLAFYGNTGKHTTGAHLHIEYDTDTKYPFHAFGIGGNGKIIKAGSVDSSKDSDSIWFIAYDQTLQGASSSNWYSEEQKTAPKISTVVEIDWETRYKTLVKNINNLLK